MTVSVAGLDQPDLLPALSREGIGAFVVAFDDLTRGRPSVVNASALKGPKWRAAVGAVVAAAALDCGTACRQGWIRVAVLGKTVSVDMPEGAERSTDTVLVLGDALSRDGWLAEGGVRPANRYAAWVVRSGAAGASPTRALDERMRVAEASIGASVAGVETSANGRCYRRSFLVPVRGEGRTFRFEEYVVEGVLVEAHAVYVDAQANIDDSLAVLQVSSSGWLWRRPVSVARARWHRTRRWRQMRFCRPGGGHACSENY